MDEVRGVIVRQPSHMSREVVMKSEELRSIQAPLKDRYREKPAAAMVTLKASGNLGEGITCKS